VFSVVKRFTQSSQRLHTKFERKICRNHSSPPISVTSASSAVKNLPPRFVPSVKKPLCPSVVKRFTQSSQRLHTKFERKICWNHFSPSSSVSSAPSAVKNSPPRFAPSVKKPQCTSWLKTPTQNSQRKKKLVICREPFFTIQLCVLSALCG
jgi:hypothetical protein